MIVDKAFNGNTFYNGFSEYLDSKSELPAVIRFNIEGYLDRVFGSMSDSVTFSHGQVVDLEAYFASDSVTFGYGWVVPKYDLNFILRNASLGIKCYYLQIRLDKYGQILYSNWLKKDFEIDKLENCIEIEELALKQANMKGFDTTAYEVDLTYKEKLDELCWVFKFKVSNETDVLEYNVFEILWSSKEIINEYQIVSSFVN